MVNNIDINKVVLIAEKAGAAIMDIYNKGYKTELKIDGSPLTEADKKSNEIICTELKKINQKIPILSEENQALPYCERKHWDACWLIDPIDGTKEFIKGTGEFTVNIALIQNQEPVLGVVFAPFLKQMYYAVRGYGAFLNGSKIIVAQKSFDRYRVIASKSHLSDETIRYIEELKKEKPVELKNIGSSLKICMVAVGQADLYPRFGATMEWDTAAAHTIALECRKVVNEYITDKPLIYNKESLLNPWFVVK